MKAKGKGARKFNWPRLTKVQRRIMLEMERNVPYQGLRMNGRYLRTAWALVAHGMVQGSSIAWYELTQRGKDYLRFGMRRERGRIEKGE